MAALETGLRFGEVGSKARALYLVEQLANFCTDEDIRGAIKRRK